MPHKRRRSSIKNKGLIVCAVLSVLLCVWSSVFALSGTWDPLRALTVTLCSPLTGLFDRMGAATSHSLEALRMGDEDYRAWETEKKQLEEQLADQQEQLAAMQQLQLENEQLRDFLSLSETHSELVLLDARTLYTADTTARLLTLDRGSRDGVEVGMPVLNAVGVMGVVSEVTRNSCKVTTLLDETVHIGVRNARSGVSGTLCGAQNGAKYATLKYMDANIDRDRDLRVGDVVVTSGSSGNFPAELVVGRIVQVGVDAYDRSPYAYVEISARIGEPTALLMIVLDERTVEPDEGESALTPDEPGADILPSEGEHPVGSETPTEPSEGNEPEGEGQAPDISGDEPLPGQSSDASEPSGEETDEGGGFMGDEEVVA